MPIFEYFCDRCKRVQEVMQKLNDPAPVCVCEEDSPVVMQKQLSLSSFRLLGSGWAVDGYSKKVKNK